MSSPSPASEVSGRRLQGNRRSIAKRQGVQKPFSFFRLLAMWPGEGMRDGQGREGVASKAPTHCPAPVSQQTSREHDLRVGFRDASHQEPSRPQA